MIIKFTDRIGIAVPSRFSEAVHRAADAQGLSVADFARLALSDRMKRAGVEHDRLPAISSPHAKARR
ncbi:MAG: hypothetical protein JWQ94_90 [Tardiphaga sp.]|nr:hypothetical protein [Tardiphaga sp.]